MGLDYKKVIGFGKRLKEEREKAKLSRADVGHMLGGVAISTLQAWEGETREPPISKLMELASILKTSANYLLTGEVANSQAIQQQQGTTALQYKEVNRKSDDIAMVSKTRLITAIETLEEILERRDRVMLPENKAQMIWIIYELLSEDESEDRENDKTFIIQLAEKLAA